jgi:hypothetical protein
VSKPVPFRATRHVQLPVGISIQFGVCPDAGQKTSLVTYVADKAETYLIRHADACEEAVRFANNWKIAGAWSGT